MKVILKKDYCPRCKGVVDLTEQSYLNPFEETIGITHGLKFLRCPRNHRVAINKSSLYISDSWPKGY